MASVFSGLLIDAFGVRQMLLVYTGVSALGAVLLFFSVQRTPAVVKE